MNGALLRLKSSFFKECHFFLLIITFFLQLTGLEKTKEGDVPQNDREKDAATGSIAGNVIVCFVN